MVAAEDDAEPGATPVKKRTRRGSRGGRRRKKRPVGADGAAAAGDDADELDDDNEGDAGDAEAVGAVVSTDAPAADSDAGPKASGSGLGPARRRAPRIHVPDGDRPSANGADAAISSPVAPDPVLTDPTQDEPTGAGADVEVTADAEPGGAPVKKKTRRGSRGGKNRRKRPAGEAAGTADEASATGEAGAEPGTDEGAAVLPTSEPENGAAPEADVEPMLRPPAPQRQRARRPAAVTPPRKSRRRSTTQSPRPHRPKRRAMSRCPSGSKISMRDARREHLAGRLFATIRRLAGI